MIGAVRKSEVSDRNGGGNVLKAGAAEAPCTRIVSVYAPWILSSSAELLPSFDTLSYEKRQLARKLENTLPSSDMFTS
eukprot:767243-Hanusia_phi.AAC.11